MLVTKGETSNLKQMPLSKDKSNKLDCPKHLDQHIAFKAKSLPGCENYIFRGYS